MTILLVAPTFDVPTTLSAIAASELTSFLQEHKYPFYMLSGLLPGRWYFETFLKMHKDVNALFYLGHGSEDRLYGAEVFWAMLDTKNDDLVQGLICWNMACLSGQQLGPDAIKKGARAWFGHLVLYNGAFPDESHNYTQDWIDYVTLVPKLLVQGMSCGDAFDAYKARLARYLSQYKEFAQNPDRYPNADWIVTTTQSNLEYARLFGDPNAKLSS